MQEGLKIAEELEKRDKENLAKNYLPNSKAEEFIKTVGSNQSFVNLFIAANGVGKSACGVNIIANLCFGVQNEWFKFPLFYKFPYLKRGRIISDPTTIKEKIIPELKKWFPSNRYKEHYTTEKQGKFWEAKWTTDTGFEFDIMSNEQDSKEFESTDLGWVWLDEPSRKDIYMATVARTRAGGIIFWTMTPLDYSAWIEEDLYNKRDGINIEYVEADVEDNCFAEDTEILTVEGWKNLGESKKGDIVATYNTALDLIEYQPVEAVIKKEFSGNLLDIGLGLLATTDHRMVVFNEYGSGKNRKRKAKDLRLEIKVAAKLYRGMRMIGVAPNNFIGSDILPLKRNIDIGDWCEFLGWYVSEGCVAGVNSQLKIGKYQVYISQNKGWKKDRIKALIQRMGLPFHERKGDVWFSDKEIHRHLFALGNKYNKYIPSYVFSFSKENLKRLWESALLGDGDGKSRYITTSPRLADDMQRLLFQIGKLGSVRTWNTAGRGKIIKSKVNQYCVKECKNRNYYVMNCPVSVNYKGFVSCVSVKNGTIVVRNKNEKYPLITGNCKEHGIRGILEHKNIERMASQYPRDEKEARMHGKFGNLLGKIIKSFNRKIHVIRPFEMPPNQYCVFMALDTHPQVDEHSLWMALDQKGQKYVIAEYVGKGTVAQIASEFKRVEGGMRVEGRLIDPSAYNKDERTVEDSFGTKLENEGFSFEMGSKDLITGIKRMQEAFDYQMTGNEWLKKPEVFIFDTCPVTIRQIESYVWVKNRGRSADTKQDRGIPIDKNDHQPENLRRLLMRNFEFISEGFYTNRIAVNQIERETSKKDYGL